MFIGAPTGGKLVTCLSVARKFLVLFFANPYSRGMPLNSLWHASNPLVKCQFHARYPAFPPNSQPFLHMQGFQYQLAVHPATNSFPWIMGRNGTGDLQPRQDNVRAASKQPEEHVERFEKYSQQGVEVERLKPRWSRKKGLPRLWGVLQSQQGMLLNCLLSAS